MVGKEVNYVLRLLKLFEDHENRALFCESFKKQKMLSLANTIIVDLTKKYK